ncbi:hypothetical protein BUE80_DR010343 [Diplocarpon rosae]|nr:hypothetical protein BUE80_DR010343 [Diplocarpon rosae]
MTPEPYTICVPQSKLDILRTKLSLVEFPDELAASEWDLGVPLADMKRLTKAWEQWDWRQAEEKLNKIPQFHTPINYAETCHKLMLCLGYNEYVTQGGDWGFTVTRSIGFLYPDHCKASHVNMIHAHAPTFNKHPILALQHSLKSYSKKEEDGLKRSDWFRREGRGYNLEQSTKPQTLAYALNDSPIALLAWIYEKLHDWTDGYPWTEDEIFTWVGIYQFSRMGPGAAHRIYFEVQHTKPGPGKPTVDVISSHIPGVKLGLAYNPKELELWPKTWCRTLGPVVFESDNETGGHFYATEQPEWLARDLRTMFGKGGGAYGVVKEKTGFDEDRAKL